MLHSPLAAACLAALTLSTLACGGSHSPSGTAGGPGAGGGGGSGAGGGGGGSGGSSGGTAIPAPTGNSIYFGASVNPQHDVSTEEAQTEAFEGQLGRTLALHMHYYPFGNITTNAPSFPNVGDTQMADDVAHHRIPVVSWGCSNIPFAKIAAGTYDTLIDNTALSVKAFGHPLFLRWAWEMNTGSSAGCQGSSGTPQSDFIQAWQRIHARFQAQGVTNVAWLWNPSGEPGASTQSSLGYFPGVDSVDWIGFDGYDYMETGDFAQVFGPFYSAFSGYGKPFLIGETGACQSLQQHYLNSATAQLDGASTATHHFPAVKGFMYWDAVGPYQKCSDGTNWTFGAAGMAAFTQMGSTPYFGLLP